MQKCHARSLPTQVRNLKCCKEITYHGTLDGISCPKPFTNAPTDVVRREKVAFEHLLFGKSDYLIRSQGICCVLHFVPAAIKHGVFSEQLRTLTPPDQASICLPAGTRGAKDMPEVLRASVSKEDGVPVHRSQTPVSTALELLIDSLCLEQGWETSSSEASPTHADGNAGGSEAGNKSSSRSEGASPGASRKSGKSRTSKPARVRFKDEKDGSGAGPSGQDEGKVGKVANGVAPELIESSQKQDDSGGVGCGPSVTAADEFESLALRFHKQPVKVSGGLLFKKGFDSLFFLFSSLAKQA